eukprot:3254098-Amphidinium_carterae.1
MQALDAPGPKCKINEARSNNCSTICCRCVLFARYPRNSSRRKIRRKSPVSIVTAYTGSCGPGCGKTATHQTGWFDSG